MFTKLSKLAIVGVLSITTGLSLGSQTSLRGHESTEAEIEYVTLESITAEMEMVFGKEIFEGPVEGGLRKLGAMTCDRGGDSSQVLTFGVSLLRVFRVSLCHCGSHTVLYNLFFFSSFRNDRGVLAKI